MANTWPQLLISGVWCQSSGGLECGRYCQTAEGDAFHESSRHFLVGRTADVLQSVPVSPVLARPLDRGVGDRRPVGVLGLGLGHRYRQNPVILAASPRRRSVRGSLLVGPVTRGAV